jgi:adenylyl-sulfate kinase
VSGVVIWFTGLSGAGKSTIAALVGRELEAEGRLVEYLDGDVVRTHLSKGLGFSREDRDTNIERIGWVASRVARAGGTVIVSAISPYAEARAKARAMAKEVGAEFVEVHVATSVEECARRDVKGLYERAFAGELKEFTGVSDPYEEPAAPELRLETEARAPEICAREVTAYLGSAHPRGAGDPGARDPGFREPLARDTALPASGRAAASPEPVA